MTHNKHPLVSVIIPCRNEEKTIHESILSLQKQQYPMDRLEIIVADGFSTDHTREKLAKLKKIIPQLYVVDNPQIITPAAMNCAIRASRGSVIVLLGAHASFSENYLAEAVKLLESEDVDCVGGRIETISSTPSAQVIAIAMSSPFGIGDAKFRYSDKEELVDTVAFGAYRREVFDRIGYFDEALPRNEDDEFNYRLRKTGGKILLSPKMRAQYYSRASLRSLWRQYYGYGKGKVKVAQKHATMMKARHIIPALFVASTVILSIISLFQPTLLFPLMLCLSSYFAVSLFFSYRVAQIYGWKYLFTLPLVFLILHVSYGCGTNMGIIHLISHKIFRGGVDS